MKQKPKLLSNKSFKAYANNMKKYRKPASEEEEEEWEDGGKLSTARPSVKDPSLLRSRSFASPARTHERNETISRFGAY